MNKWDTIPNKNQETTVFYEEDVRRKVRSLSWAPIVYSTAIAGHSVEKYVTYSIHFLCLYLFLSCFTNLLPHFRQKSVAIDFDICDSVLKIRCVVSYFY